AGVLAGRAGQAVVDRVGDQARADLACDGDRPHQRGRRDDHARVLHEEAAEREALFLARPGELGEDGVALAALRLFLQEEVDTLLQLVRDAAERQAGLRGARRTATA